jgi:hypothetical protein
MTEEYLREQDFVTKAEDKGFESEAVDLCLFLKKLKYPISKTKLLSEARKKLPEEIVQHLKVLREEIYEDVDQVMGQI